LDRFLKFEAIPQVLEEAFPKVMGMPRKESSGMAVREITASGSHYNIGLSIGKKCRDLALFGEKRFKKMLAEEPGMTVKKAVAQAKRSLPMTKAFCPEYVQELEGFADGAGLDLEFVYAMMHNITGVGKGKGCTDIAVNSEWTKDDCVFAAHNDDVSPDAIKTLTLVRIKPEGEPGFLGLAYYGIQPTNGMNAAGISLTGNAVTQNDTRVGIPEEVAVRKILAQPSLYQALRASMPVQRGNSYNNIICDSSGEIYSMEGSATTFDALYAEDGWLIHTNHYLSPKMWRFEEDMHTRHSSIIRYNRATRLFKKELGKVELPTFKRILSDHVSYPESICRHADPQVQENDLTQTAHSVVYDLTNRAAWICIGNPCTGQYKKYEF